jgi:hypothetical protein
MVQQQLQNNKSNGSWARPGVSGSVGRNGTAMAHRQRAAAVVASQAVPLQTLAVPSWLGLLPHDSSCIVSSRTV